MKYCLQTIEPIQRAAFLAATFVKINKGNKYLFQEKKFFEKLKVWILLTMNVKFHRIDNFNYNLLRNFIKKIS